MNSRVAVPLEKLPTASRPQVKVRARRRRGVTATQVTNNVEVIPPAKTRAKQPVKAAAKAKPKSKRQEALAQESVANVRELPDKELSEDFVAASRSGGGVSSVVPAVAALPSAKMIAVVCPRGMRREYVEWESEVMERRMEMLVFGHGGERVLVFPTRRGRFYEYEDGGLVEVLRPQIEAGRIQLFCVDGIDAESVYNKSISPQQRIMNHVRYEQHILHEVLPHTERVNANPVLVSHGASLGAWHAMNIAMRHPHLFTRVVCLSGRYDLTASMPPDFGDLFDGYYDQTIYYNMPLHFLPRMSDPELMAQLRRLEVTLVVGEQDPFLANNRDMSHVLTEAGIRNSLHLWSGRAHRFARWREMLPRFISPSAGQ